MRGEIRSTEYKRAGELYSEGVVDIKKVMGDILRRVGEIYTEGEVISKEERARVF